MEAKDTTARLNKAALDAIETSKFSLDIFMDNNMISGVNLTAYLQEFAFQGFDPKYFAKVLMYYAKDQNALKEDMLQIIAFYITRGTRPDRKRIEDTMTREGYARITKLVNKYHMDTRKKPSAREDVTIGRIASTFPHWVVTLLNEHADKSQVRVIADEARMYLRLPRALCIAVAYAVIPRSQEWDGLFCAVFIWGKEFTRTIMNNASGDDVRKPNTGNAADAASMLTAAWKTQLNIAKTQRSSDAVPEEIRQDVMKRIGVDKNAYKLRYNDDDLLANTVYSAYFKTV